MLIPVREMSELVRIPITGIGATQKKMERDPDEIMRLLRALRSATQYMLDQPEYSVALYQRVMRAEEPRADRRLRRARKIRLTESLRPGKLTHV